MPRLPARPREELDADPEIKASLDMVMRNNGYIANNFLTLGHVPDILRPFLALTREVLRVDREVPRDLKWLVGHVASRTAGCQYCALHTISNGAKTGADPAKVEAVWDYETSPLFSDAERAALRVAQLASQVPNMVDDETFAALRRHWSVTQCTEIMAVIALFGFLNRWADTIKTDLEDIPLDWADKHRLTERGWDGSEHRPQAAE